MKISDLRTGKDESRVFASASVVWEDCDRPQRDVFYATTHEYEGDLTCNPHSFLVGCILPALRNGERRIQIDAEICPELREGLITAMAWLTNWSGSIRPPVTIEAKTTTHSLAFNKPHRAASFLSGGIDSLFTLRFNRNQYPREHPSSIKDCIFVHGGDIGGIERPDMRLEFFERNIPNLLPIAQEAGVALIPMYTNVRHLDDDDYFWLYEFHGAFLASIAHALTKRISDVYVASTYDIAHLHGLGSHPLLDPNYGSSDLRIRHDSVRFSRLAKVRVVADWDTALQHIRVCTRSEGTLNCGECEKCIRTKSALVAVGALDKTAAFNEDDISTDLLGSVRLENDYQASCYEELIKPLRMVGRNDLARFISKMVKTYHTKKRIMHVDRNYFNGNIHKLWMHMKSLR